MATQLQKAYASSEGIFLSYPGIAGESKQVGHEGQIEISSFQFGSGRPVQAGSTTAGAPSISEVTITKLSDKSTPLLFYSSLVGKAPSINPATISFSTTPAVAGSKPVDYMTIKLSNPLISSYSVSSGGDRPSESISLSFTKIEMTWIPINADGTKGTAITRSYDLATAKIT
jgi:type VI secretion system secreted protein Hcp